MKKGLKTNPRNNMPDKPEENTLPGYPVYPEGEDIYHKFREEKNIDPEDITRVKETVKGDSAPSVVGKESNDEVSGIELDVPGSELDDEQENVGNEDEENNYYSIGGDNHNNLDEDKDELY